MIDIFDFSNQLFSQEGLDLIFEQINPRPSLNLKAIERVGVVPTLMTSKVVQLSPFQNVGVQSVISALKVQNQGIAHVFYSEEIANEDKNALIRKTDKPIWVACTQPDGSIVLRKLEEEEELDECR